MTNSKTSVRQKPAASTGAAGPAAPALPSDGQIPPPATVLPPEAPEAARPMAWGPWMALVYGVCVFFGSQVVAGLLLSSVLSFSGKSYEDISQLLSNSVAAQFAATLLAESLMIAGIFAYVTHHGARLRDIGWDRFRSRYIWRALLWFGVYFGVYILAFAVLSRFIPALNAEEKQDLGFSDPTTVADKILLGISLIVLPPLAEEILFRGFLYRGMRRRFSFVPAAVVTSVLFAVGHLQLGNGGPLLWVAALDTFILSLFLCYVREKSGSLWPGILMHAIKNAIAFSVLYIFQVA